MLRFPAYRTMLTWKTAVFGAVERGGKVRAEVIPKGEKGTIPKRAVEFALPSAVVFTDEYAAYDKAGKHYQEHHRIRHAQSITSTGTSTRRPSKGSGRS